MGVGKRKKERGTEKHGYLEGNQYHWVVDSKELRMGKV